MLALKVEKVKWHTSAKGQLNNLLVVPEGGLVPETLKVVRSSQSYVCRIPNCPNLAKELYGIKHRKGSKSNAFVVKQIFVCKKHYLLIYSGKYDGPSLKKLKGYPLRNFN